MIESKHFKNLFAAGFILIFISTLILFLSGLNRAENSDFFDGNSTFFFNYLISAIFFIVIFAYNRPFFRLRKIDKRLIIILLTLFSISAFTLNHAVPIFAQFSSWVVYYLFLFYLSFIGVCFIDKVPKPVKLLIHFFLGAGLMMLFYFASYLAPLYHLAILGAVFFGLSLHLLAPLMVAIAVIVIFARLKKSVLDKISFYSGIVIPLIIVAIFVLKWDGLKKDLHSASSATITRPGNTLPKWVLLSQIMPTDNFSQKIIEGDLIYDTFQRMWRGWGRNGFDEVKKHDPLVNIGLGLVGDLNIDTDTRIKILKSQYNARHLAQRKLWSGRNIGTIEVLNNIKIYPDYRLAYTEKIITIKNFHQWENSQQEAAYTFYLPEGSVATSLSLWIEGKEEKSRLTTKSKADSAYVRVVGVDRKDPAILHWQEGNTFTVTVFPCTPKENRVFKIGITTPLEKKGDDLILKNIYYEGPISKDIMETSVINFESSQAVENINLPQGFKEELNQKYTYTGKYRAYWEIGCKATALSKHPFVFNNKTYRIGECANKTIDFEPGTVYLDINKSWDKAEFSAVLEILASKKVWVHHDRLIEINQNNKNHLFEILSKHNFSLFPFNKIKNIENSLVISKSKELSPNLSDLEGTVFAKELTKGINAANTRINLFQIGNFSSPYLKTLKELQVFNFNLGTVEDLANIIKENRWTESNENVNSVDLEIANLSIFRDSIPSTESKAPDHLLRLFAYNKIMKDLGRNYFNKNSLYVEKLVAIANEAYVVSPISSLIVLETVKDYDRFNIGENANSLKNASMSSSGAVPEPEEWLLIGVLFLIILVLFVKKNSVTILRCWKK